MENKKAIETFAALLEAIDQILGPEGCLWHKEQTFETLKGLLLEEAYEIIDAIESQDMANLIEELGDLLYNVILLSKMGEKLQLFKVGEPLEGVHKKLTSRHPHVFGTKKAKDLQEVMRLWEEVKKEEKRDRKSALDGIASKLPALARGFKVAQRAKLSSLPSFTNEKELGDCLWQLILEATTLDLNPELALRRKLGEIEKTFRQKEKE